MLTPEMIRAYVERDWSGARARKRAYWRTRLEDGGLRASLQVTEQLRRWMMCVNVHWPTEAERDEDLATHQRVSATLAKTSRISQRFVARSRADRNR